LDALNKRRIALDEGKNEWRGPINFYGKVIDENGDPVADAMINFGWTDLPPTGHSTAQTKSGVDGRFLLTGKTGKNLLVEVAKQGYYTSKQNRDSFTYRGNNDNFVPDPQNPQTFYLKKHGQAEPLIVIKKNTRIARDGTPFLLDLKGAKLPKAQTHQIRVECETHDEIRQPDKRYDWRCRVSVPNGGLVESTNEFWFTAPETGYQSQAEINMPASAGEYWKSDVEKHYFLKFADGTYGRMFFAMVAAGDHFCMVESYINPSGSRNLEYDQTVQPKSSPSE
jgi:hypothetical protein